MRFPRHHIRKDAFTLVEVLVASSAAMVILAGVYALVSAGMILSVKSLAINATGRDVRLAVDRTEAVLLQAYDVPTLVNHAGATVSGSGPAAGVRFFRYLGGPYVVTIPTIGLSGTSTALTITRDNTALVLPPPPLPNDVIVINTTILMSGSTNQVRATIVDGSTIATSTNGNRVSYTVKLKGTLGDANTLIPYKSSTAVTTTVIRPSAFVVVPTAKGRELRYMESFPPSTPLDVSQKHSVYSEAIALPAYDSTPSTGDAMSDNNARPFALEKLYGRTFVNTRFRVRDTRYGRHLQGKQADEFSTFMGVNALISSKCNPNE